ncbi:IS607 family transposase [Umezakia ovalisporum]|jgi:predicted site-specific integrase-resolvase|uniref:IS607 family transposase n=2 Tax=Umezakia ovalisporum TaxID=75695 RepID=A0AA43GWD1_9CYAN|nr:IS607 family transposase [Umezakia ovalisporum]MBI1240112.1 IS607 family transposase [Nostoc sp. RI_552]MDH6057024.1 IS607 family transposase [Umezakia ovalisporum FSS-43]MDH6062387.1 IS607 family transposase [Umezakia ovalisporum FSS-62]MDH6068474.1 IS607 family transposase [Umezakia ovalisporum APH033B]MDH6071215.1 IS607 family transposase [Umezakia ovalisporum CobakiLakeA]
MAYVPLREAVKQLGLHPNTLRKYADNGKIESIKNEAGQRLFNVESYLRGATRTSFVCYCRVGSTKQRDDLGRQIAYMQSLYPDAEIIKDIGSGINFKRKGLQALLDRLMRGDKLTIVVACRDRLARFGFELIQYMVEQNGGRIVVLDNNVHCPESELTSDLLSILHLFSCRMHGLRKYSKKIKEDPDLSHNRAQADR